MLFSNNNINLSRQQEKRSDIYLDLVDFDTNSKADN